MSSLASINIKFTADLKGFSTEMQNSLRQIDKAGQQFQKIGRSMSAFVTLPLLAAGGAAVKFASDYNESLNKVDVSFKSSSVQVKEFAKTSLESFGIASGTALDLAATYGDMATGMGLTTGEAAKMSTSLVGLAGDLASFKNISIDIANTALTSIFSGETESLKKLGVIMTEVNLKQFALNSGIKKTYETMSQAEKVQLRYNYVLSVTKNSQGDFARTQGGASNQMRIFTESLKQIGQQLGVVILPLFTKLITVVNEKIKAFTKLSEGTKTVIVVVAGLVAVIGPLLLVIGGILSIIPAVVAGFALISGAIVPILAGIVLLGGALFVMKNAFADTAKASVQLNESQKLSKKITEDATAAIVAQKAQLKSFVDIAKDETKSKKERADAIKEINKISPEYLGNITLETINTASATAAVTKYNEALLRGAKARAAQAVLQDLYKKEIETELRREKGLATANKLKEEANKKQFTSAKAQQEYNDLLNDKSGILKTLQSQQDKNTQKEIATVAKIYNDGKDYLKLLEDTAVQEDVLADKKAKKAKSPANLSALDAPLTNRLSTGTIEAYDAEIAKLKEFRDTVAITAEQIKLADDKIAAVELAKSLNFDPSSVIKSVETTEEMMARLAASVSGAKAVIEVEQNSMIANATSFNEQFSAVWQNTIGGFAENFGALIGQFAAGGASLSSIGSLFLTTLADMAIQVGKIAITVGLAVLGIKKALESLNPVVAIAAGVALIAIGTFAKTSLSKASGGQPQAFANGGIVGGTSYYGDKIMARVNSAEMVSNTDQQKKIWNGMNSGGSDAGGFVASAKLVGSDLLIWLERAQARKSRTS